MCTIESNNVLWIYKKSKFNEIRKANTLSPEDIRAAAYFK